LKNKKIDLSDIKYTKVGFSSKIYSLEKYIKKRELNSTAERYNLRPIPEDAITLNDALTEADQNPGF
jgi:hypothetical protein